MVKKAKTQWKSLGFCELENITTLSCEAQWCLPKFSDHAGLKPRQFLNEASGKTTPLLVQLRESSRAFMDDNIAPQKNYYMKINSRRNGQEIVICTSLALAMDQTAVEIDSDIQLEIQKQWRSQVVLEPIRLQAN